MHIFFLTEEEYQAIQSGLSLHSEQIQQLQKDLAALRLQAVPSATPETPVEEEVLPPALGAMADEQPSKVVPISTESTEIPQAAAPSVNANSRRIGSETSSRRAKSSCRCRRRTSQTEYKRTSAVAVVTP